MIKKIKKFTSDFNIWWEKNRISNSIKHKQCNVKKFRDAEWSEKGETTQFFLLKKSHLLEMYSLVTNEKNKYVYPLKIILVYFIFQF